jgi:hypothetical protein
MQMAGWPVAGTPAEQGVLHGRHPDVLVPSRGLADGLRRPALPVDVKIPVAKDVFLRCH